MTINNRFRQLREIESGINKNLFFISGAVTVLVMGMIIIEFFTRGVFLATNISFFYLGVLLIYSLHKELVRWLGKRKMERQGEYFVYSWIGLTTFLYVINFLTKDYFSYSADGSTLTVLKGVSVLTLEVLVIFILTRGLKILKIFLVRPKKE